MTGLQERPSFVRNRIPDMRCYTILRKQSPELPRSASSMLFMSLSSKIVSFLVLDSGQMQWARRYSGASHVLMSAHELSDQGGLNLTLPCPPSPQRVVAPLPPPVWLQVRHAAPQLILLSSVPEQYPQCTGSCSLEDIPDKLLDISHTTRCNLLYGSYQSER